MRHKEEYNNRADNIQSYPVSQRDNNHAETHTEGVDNKKQLPAESVRQGLVKHGKRLKRYGYETDCIQHADALFTEMRHKVVGNLGLHKRTYLRSNFIRHINKADDKNKINQIVMPSRPRLFSLPFFDFLLLSQSFFFKLLRAHFLWPQITSSIHSIFPRILSFKTSYLFLFCLIKVYHIQLFVFNKNIKYCRHKNPG